MAKLPVFDMSGVEGSVLGSVDANIEAKQRRLRELEGSLFIEATRLVGT